MLCFPYDPYFYPTYRYCCTLCNIIQCYDKNHNKRSVIFSYANQQDVSRFIKELCLFYFIKLQRSIYYASHAILCCVLTYMFLIRLGVLGLIQPQRCSIVFCVALLFSSTGPSRTRLLFIFPF